jgi:soluble lytic murein transglycosylase-like protein
MAAAASGPSVPATATVPSSNGGVRQLVDQLSREHGLDPKLMDALVRVESGYDPRAVSHKGAMGLMQLMPETATRLGIRNPFDPEQNIRGGMREFARLVDRYRGDLQLALAAYNAGEAAVAQYRGVPPYRETRNYVSRILTIYTGRPYRLSAGFRAAPVRLVTDPGTGQSVITNLPNRGSSTGVTLHRPSGASGPLRGGFGSTGG